MPRSDPLTGGSAPRLLPPLVQVGRRSYVVHIRRRSLVHFGRPSVVQYEPFTDTTIATGDPANYYASQPGGVPNGPPVGQRYNFPGEDARQLVDSGASPVPQPDPEPVYSRPPFPQDSVTRQSLPNRRSLYDRPTDVSMPSTGPRRLVDPRNM